MQKETLIRFFCGIGLAMALVGCGGETDVAGEVYLDGELYGSSTSRVVKVSIQPLPKANANHPLAITVDVNESGNFKVPGLAPGDYVAQVHDFAPFPFHDRLASHFRNNPAALRLTVPAEDSKKLEIRSDWYRHPKSSRRR